MASLPAVTQGPAMALEKPPGYRHLSWGLFPGLGRGLWRSCQPDPALTEGLLLGFGGGATKSNQVSISKVRLVICCINSYLHVISWFLCCDMWVQAEEF